MTKKPLTLFAGAAALALALTGCGTTQTTPTTEGSAAPATSASEGCADDTTTTSTDPVELTDAFGRTVTLDQPAERVAVLEWQQIEDVLSLCLTPVAVADADGYRTWNSAEELPESVESVGTRQEPNLDALFATEPDLVIVEAYTRDDAIIAQLEEYGVPVLATVGANAEDPIAQMLDTFGLIAEAIGREERAEVVTDEFEQYLADAKAEVEGASPEVTDFVYFDGWVDGGNVSIRPFGQGSLVGELGEELGLTNAWTGEVDPAYGLGQTDIEGMTTVGDAHLFYTGTEDPDSESFIDAAESNPAWASIPAVAEGRIAAFPAGIWTFGGPRSAEQIIDAYVAAITQ
ncbi:iron-siderophore ABC transporter substrate-binding protein [Microbacterium sp. ET2]|uniref:iron-siderophore ABC transporter substrate-binding protein n=1 Tax=Microbacterium albipurpureum TaxID=3050384 RepID=UPI00259CCF61|nr:iron-siderophore ABC transporter substrate-binding protein [Microbacterium sp. ET2 (Ac-2212)]WJL94904.1 iron-siderophore ABC transporter substrate-binding protein [Microbacterium sp. ET2 (Ac-2212)]